MNANYRSIEFNLRIGCPIACSYCPQSLFLNSKPSEEKFFNKENFLKILENASFPNSTLEVFFAGMSEPLSEKKWIEYAEICENNHNVSKLFVFTTGYKITQEDIKTISNLKKINIYFHVNENKYMKNFDENIWNKLPIIKKYLPNSIFFLVGFDIKEFDIIVSRLRYHDLRWTFQKIISRSGNLKSVGEKHLHYKKDKCMVTCEKMNEFKRPVVHPDGTALACCNDYGCEMKIGNLLKQKWNELDFQKIINMQRDYNSNLPCFRDCHFAKKYKKIF